MVCRVETLLLDQMKPMHKRQAGSAIGIFGTRYPPMSSLIKLTVAQKPHCMERSLLAGVERHSKRFSINMKMTGESGRIW
jgi:hypothetical protein